MKVLRIILPFLLIIVILTGCESFGDSSSFFADIAAGSGLISETQADALSSAAYSVEKAFETLTPEQEYYVGRSVAANIMASYSPFDDKAANEYLNELGQSLALLSDRPEIFNGYRFLLLDSDEINAFATPGGFIMVSRGMLECASDEGTLAAVLAHELGHVQLDHGIKAIKTSRWTDAITKTAVAGASLNDAENAEVLQSFGGSIDDITQTLVVGGYSKDQEKEADAFAAELLSRVGYDPQDIIRMLEEMDARWDPDGHGFATTHPAPSERIRKVTSTVNSLPAPQERSNFDRDRRYAAAFAGI